MESESLFKPPETRKLKAGRVRLSPGEEVGEHVTEKREESIVVLKGDAAVLVDGKEHVISQGNAFYISEGKRHNVKNNGKKELEYVYVVSLL